MAIDTRDKRQSVIGVCLPVPTLLPTADSDVDEFDRRNLVWLYQALAEIGVAPTFICHAVVKLRQVAVAGVELRQAASAEVEV